MVERQTSFERSLGADRESYCDLIVPKATDGTVLYETLGKLLTAKSLEEVHCASYVDPKFGRKLEISGVPDTDWEYISEMDDVVILRKYNHKTKINCFMGRGLVNAPMSEVQKYIGQFETRYDYDPMLSEIKVVKHLSNTDYIVYMSHHVEKFWGLLQAHQDSCFFSRQIVRDGAYIQTCMSIEDPVCPEKNGYTRMELLPGCGWVLHPYPADSSQTIVTYLAHMHLRGMMPSVLVNIILKKQPLVIARVRKVFELKSKGLYQPKWPGATSDTSLGGILNSRGTSAGIEKSEDDYFVSGSQNQTSSEPAYREPLIFDSSESDFGDSPSRLSSGQTSPPLLCSEGAEAGVTRTPDRAPSEPHKEEQSTIFHRVSSWIWKSSVSSEPRPVKGYCVQPMPPASEESPVCDTDSLEQEEEEKEKELVDCSQDSRVLKQEELSSSS